MNGKKLLKSTLNKILALIIFIGAWYLLFLLMDNQVILPSPLKVFTDFIDLIKTGKIWLPLLTTLFRVLISFILALILGVLLGFLSFYSKVLNTIFKPFLTVIKSTPLLVLILLAIIWFKQGMVPIFATFLVVFPIIFGNVLEGLKSIDSLLLEMAQLFKFSKKKIIKDLYLPHLTPFLFSGVSTGLGVAWKAVVAAEILIMPTLSLGESIMRAKLELDSSLMFSWTIVIIVFSALTELLAKHLFSLASWNRSRND